MTDDEVAIAFRLAEVVRPRAAPPPRAFHAYAEVPAHEVPKLVEATKKEREELLVAR